MTPRCCRACLPLPCRRLKAGVMGVLFRACLLTRAADAAAAARPAWADGANKQAARRSSSGRGGGGRPAAAGGAAGAAAAAADINTLMAVDAGRLANLALSVQELWSLPLQILAAMTLLYLQVRV
jgi:hypothetical protein